MGQTGKPSNKQRVPVVAPTVSFAVSEVKVKHHLRFTGLLRAACWAVIAPTALFVVREAVYTGIWLCGNVKKQRVRNRGVVNLKLDTRRGGGLPSIQPTHDMSKHYAG